VSLQTEDVFVKRAFVGNSPVIESRSWFRLPENIHPRWGIEDKKRHRSNAHNLVDRLGVNGLELGQGDHGQNEGGREESA